MISFENNKLNNLALPMSIVRMLTTINRVFENMRVDGKIEAVGKGRNTKWKKL